MMRPHSVKAGSLLLPITVQVSQATGNSGGKAASNATVETVMVPPACVLSRSPYYTFGCLRAFERTVSPSRVSLPPHCLHLLTPWSLFTPSAGTPRYQRPFPKSPVLPRPPSEHLHLQVAGCILCVWPCPSYLLRTPGTGWEGTTTLPLPGSCSHWIRTHSLN